MRTDGKYNLYQWVDPGSNGSTEDLGAYDSLREATEAARLFAKVSKLKGHFGCSYMFGPEEKLEHGFDGRSYQITLDPPYFPHQEITLSDGRRVWLEDVDEALRTILDTPV